MNSNEEIINELNTLKKEYNPYADKDRAIEVQNRVKQLLQDAPNGTEMYRVVKETSSGWTSHGSYSDTRAVMKKLKKENGVWEMYGRRRDTIDDAMWSILYNDGDLMTKADAQAELAKQKENDVSTHRDIVNVGTDNAGNPVGKSTNRIDYPNKKEESTDASYLKIENVTPIYTGGGIYIYTGELSDGNYFIASDQSFVGDYFDIRIVDENPADYEEDFCDVTWQEEHLVSDVVGGEAREFTIQLLEWVLENHPEGNYQLGDIEAMLDSIQNKVEESTSNNTVEVKWFDHRDYDEFKCDIIQGILNDGRQFLSGDYDSVTVYEKGYNAIERLNDKAKTDDEDISEEIDNDMNNHIDYSVSDKDLDIINNIIYDTEIEESKKVCENTSSVDWEEENFDLIWDEYAKRKSKELGVTRDEIPEWGEEGFDEELYNEVAWELYNSDAGLPDPDMYMESKEPRSMSREDIMSCYISDITEAAYTYTPQEAQEEINNIFDDLKNDKDLDDVDKRFILKMVRGTLLNRDIKFPEITENKKVEEKYEYWSDKTEYTYFIVKDGTPTMHEIYTVINRKDNTITEIKDGEVRDTTAHCKELYNKDKRQNFMNKNGNYIGTDFYNCLLTGRLKVPTGDEVLIYTNNEDEFTLMLNNLKSVHLKTEAVRYVIYKNEEPTSSYGNSADSYTQYSDIDEAIEDAKEIDADYIEKLIYKNEDEADREELADTVSVVWKNKKKKTRESKKIEAALSKDKTKITENEIKVEYKPVELGDTGENSWNTVSVYDDGLAEQSILALLDKRKIYELNYENGKKQLVKIYGVEWGSTAQCEDVLSGEQFKVDIKDMLQDGRVYETDYVIEDKQVKTEEANTFGVAEDMYNKTHKDKWHTLSDDEKASYYNKNYKRIKKQADNLDKKEENKKVEAKVNADALKISVAKKLADDMIKAMGNDVTGMDKETYYKNTLVKLNDPKYIDSEIKNYECDNSNRSTTMVKDLNDLKKALTEAIDPEAEEDKEIWNKVEKIVDLVDTEIEPDSNDEFDYDEHITFVFYRDLEDIDMYEVYTYLDGEIQEDLDTGDVHISDLDSTLVDIVKKLKEVN